MNCPCEKDVAVLGDKVKKLEKKVDGNGNPGLEKQMIEVKMRVKTIEESVSSLSTSYSALANSQLEQDVLKSREISAREKRVRAWQIFGIAVASACAVLGSVYMIIYGIQH